MAISTHGWDFSVEGSKRTGEGGLTTLESCRGFGLDPLRLAPAILSFRSGTLVKVTTWGTLGFLVPFGLLFKDSGI